MVVIHGTSRQPLAIYKKYAIRCGYRYKGDCRALLVKQPVVGCNPQIAAASAGSPRLLLSFLQVVVLVARLQHWYLTFWPFSLSCLSSNLFFFSLWFLSFLWFSSFPRLLYVFCLCLIQFLINRDFLFFVSFLFLQQLVITVGTTRFRDLKSYVQPTQCIYVSYIDLRKKTKTGNVCITRPMVSPP